MRVFIAGPYSQGSVTHNVRLVLGVADMLLRRGYAPYVPHLNHLWQLVFPNSYETWMRLDFAYLKICQAMLRLPGDSPGADREEAEAKRLGVPVYYTLEAFPPLPDEESA
jgi:hypothetical protein